MTSFAKSKSGSAFLWLTMGIGIAATAQTQQALPSGTAAAASPVFDTWAPAPCSPIGQSAGGCPPGTRHPIRVVTVATGLVQPWQMAFLPDGKTMLVTEVPGRLRIIRDGVLAPQPVSGWPGTELKARGFSAVVVHPDFARNHHIYLTFTKGDARGTTLALAQAQLNGDALTGVKEIFVADAMGASVVGGRAHFGPDGKLYVAIADRDPKFAIDDSSLRMQAQNLNSHIGKVLRLNDDGTAPADNPFFGRNDAKPEIYTYGHRNVSGISFHPETGQPWVTDIGPMGGDELNVLEPGKNYGWPLVSFGKIYNGHFTSENPFSRPGMELPVMFWVPSIAPSGVIFYTGDKFPHWKGHLFIGALSGQQLQRVAFNQPPPHSERRETLLQQLGIRVRDVIQGSDGYLYVSTEKAVVNNGDAPPTPEQLANGSVLRIEPAE